MRSERVMVFTDREEEFANLLIMIGIRKNVAKVLVFLANIPEATFWEIERGTDLRQPEVSLALKDLTQREWIGSHQDHSMTAGHRVRIYSLAKSMDEIFTCIENEKKEILEKRMALIRKLRDYIPE